MRYPFNQILNIEASQKNFEELYMSNTTAALYMASQELLFLFFSLCGLNTTATSFFILNSNVNYVNKVFNYINLRGTVHTILGVIGFIDKKKYSHQ